MIASPQEHNIISVSGGKDSTALVLLAIERGVENLQFVFADTGHEHPQTYDYLRYLSDWLVSKGHPAERWVKHTVVGYYVWKDLGGSDSLHRVFVRVRSADGYLNARMLKDVRPLIAKPEGAAA